MLDKIKRFLEPLKRNRKLIIPIFAMDVFGGLWGYASPWFFSQITHYFEISQHTKTLSHEAFRYIAIYATLYTFYIICVFLSRNKGLVWRNFTIQSIYNTYIQKFFKLDNNKAELLGTGKLTEILSRGTEGRTHILDFMTSTLANQVISVASAFVLIYQLDKDYFFVGLVTAILFVPILIRLSGKTMLSRKARKEISITKQRAQIRFFMSKFEILQSSKIDHEIEKQNSLQKEYINFGKKQKTREFFTFKIPNILSTYLKIGVMVVTGWAIYKSETNLATFVGLRTALGYVSQALQQITSNFLTYPDKFIDVEKLWETFDNNKPMIGYDTGKEFKYKKGLIELKNISYSYNNDSEIIRNLSLTIYPQKTTAIVGTSGGGKTTLMKLIAGYLQSQGGSITIDNQELPNANGSNDYISLKSYFKHIGYLSQDPSVFDGTIKENLLYAIENEKTVTREQLEKVIELAQCQFIYQFKHGLDTEIGERGIKLSGGQRQRLAIAKLMLKNPQIILLDEPTSALDSFSEEDVSKALYNLFKGRTTIIVAHRLQTVKKADKILVLGNSGTIIEEGTHEQLINTKGTYAKMLELQS